MDKILVINPGSTSTKLAIYEKCRMVAEVTVPHEPEFIAEFSSVTEQLHYRRALVEAWLEDRGESIDSFAAIAARGGLLRPVASGTYRVNDKMLADLRQAVYGEHASNLGAQIAAALTRESSVPCYIADPVIVDELQPLARISGHPLLARKSVFHALNHRAVARRAAGELGKTYEESALIVVHLGGGITVAAHQNGKVIDVNNGLDGDGPFSPERTGALPAGQLVALCFSGNYSQAEIQKMLNGRGGMFAYVNSKDMRAVEESANEGDSQAALLFAAMAYQISKEIGAYSTVLYGRADAIVITGGIAHSGNMIALIKERVATIAPVMVYPGEDENTALAAAVVRVLNGRETAKEY